MAFSAWKIWCHPKLTASVMDDYERTIEASASATDLQSDIEARDREIGRLQADTDALRAEAEALRAETATLRSEAADLRRDLAEAAEATASLREKMAAMEEELSRRADTERQLSEFGDILDRAEQMKARYEERIARLRRALETARRSQGQTSGIDEELTIDMTATPTGDTIGSEATKETACPAESSTQESPQTPATDEWLEDLPL